MKAAFFRKIILGPMLGIVCTLQMQAQTPVDSLPSKTKFPFKYYIAIDPFHMAVGEWKLNMEVQWHKRWGTELDAGYFNNRYSIVYNKFVSYSTNQSFIDNKQFYELNEGLGGNLSLKYYRKGDIKNGSFFLLTAGYRWLHYDNVITGFDEYNPSPICNNCYVYENIDAGTLALRIGYGWQVRVVKNVIASFFINLGYKVVINNSKITAIKYSNSVFGLGFGFGANRDPQFYYDNYRIKYYQYLPSLDLGIKIGWGR